MKVGKITTLALSFTSKHRFINIKNGKSPVFKAYATTFAFIMKSKQHFKISFKTQLSKYRDYNIIPLCKNEKVVAGYEKFSARELALRNPTCFPR